LDIFATGMTFGLMMGGILSLTVLGISVVYGITGVPNFAIGLIGVIGGYTAWYFTADIGITLAIFLGIAVCFGIGFLLQIILLTPLSKKGADATLFFIITISLGLILQGLIRIVFPKPQISIELPRIGNITIAGVSADGVKFLALAVAVVTLVLIRFLERNSKFGKMLQGTEQNLKLAKLIGINTSLIFALSHGIGCSLAAVGAIFWGSIYSLNLSTGWNLAFTGYIIAVIGGIGNIWGGLLSALVMGFVISFAGYFLGGVWQSVVLYSIVILVLVIRPRGILGSERSI